MSSSFKVEKMSMLTNNSKNIKQNLNPIESKLNDEVNIIFNINQINVFNYDIQTLLQAIQTIFQDQDQGGSSFKSIETALQIITLSSTDKNIMSKLQVLLNKNIYKKQSIYTMICIWCEYLPVNSIINLFSYNFQVTLTHLIVQIYLTHFSSFLAWYENFFLAKQIRIFFQQSDNKMKKILQQLEGDIQNMQVNEFQKFLNVTQKLVIFAESINFVSNGQNQINNLTKICKIMSKFFSQNSKFSQQLVSIFLDNFLNQSGTLIIKIFTLLQKLQKIKQNNDLKVILQKLMYTQLDNNFNCERKQKIFQLIKNLYLSEAGSTNKISESARLYLQELLKSWLSSANLKNLKCHFNQNYFIYQLNKGEDINKITQKRHFILNTLSKMFASDEKVSQHIKCLFISRYLYHYFEGRPFHFVHQLNYLEEQKTNLGMLSIEKQIISKNIRHIKNEKILNVLLFNKSNFFNSLNHWEIDKSLQSLKTNIKNTLFKKFLKYFEQIWGNISTKLLNQNKKIELHFSVIRINFDKKPIYLTFKQLIQFLQKYENGSFEQLMKFEQKVYQKHYSTQFFATDTMGKSTLVQKQEHDHPIILQAKIIKLMKKQLKRATCSQISQALKIQVQKCQPIIKKLVSKGYLQEKQGSTYEYQP